MTLPRATVAQKTPAITPAPRGSTPGRARRASQTPAGIAVGKLVKAGRMAQVGRAGARCAMGDTRELPQRSGVGAAAAGVPDKRRSVRPKAGLGVRGALRVEMHEIFRAAVQGAVDSGLTQAQLARRLGVSESGLEKARSPGDRYELPWSIVAGLLAREDVLPRGVREAAITRLMRELGVRGVTLDAVADSRVELDRAGLRTAVAAGRLCDLVESAVSPDGDGGTAVTPAEARLIGAAAERVVGIAEVVAASAAELSGGGA
jgi:hypothetical protein